MIRRHLSYANIVATMALVLAMGGGAAYAACHYLITSTKQIKPVRPRLLEGQGGPGRCRRAGRWRRSGGRRGCRQRGRPG